MTFLAILLSVILWLNSVIILQKQFCQINISLNVITPIKPQSTILSKLQNQNQNQSQSQKQMEQLLFKPHIKDEELQMCLKILTSLGGYSTLYSQIRESAKTLQSSIKHDSKQELNFFCNYQTLAKLLLASSKDTAINLVLHWVNLYGQRLIEKNSLKRARTLFECVLSYLENKKIDRLLLCTALNNLVLLLKYQQRFSQSLSHVLKNIQLCVQQIKASARSKQTSRKESIQIFSVILVNSFKNARDIIIKLSTAQGLNEKDQQQLYQLYDRVNNLGYEACVVYLGKKSYFIKYFQAFQKQQNSSLPSERHEYTKEDTENVISVKQKAFKQFQINIYKKLQKIQTIIREKQKSILIEKGPSFQVVKQQIMIKQDLGQIGYIQGGFQRQTQRQTQYQTQYQPQHQPQRQIQYQNQYQPQHQTQYQPQYQTQHQTQYQPQYQSQYQPQRRLQNQSQGHIQLELELYPQTQRQPQQQSKWVNGFAKSMIQHFVPGSKVDEECIQQNGWRVHIQLTKIPGHKTGKLQFQCQHIKSKQSFIQQLSQSKLLRVLNLISLQNTLPYEYSPQNLPPNFITVCISPYFSISKQGVIGIHPLSKGVLDGFLERDFYGCRCLVALSHVRGGWFRLACSPVQLNGSLYLDVEIGQSTLQELFQELLDPSPLKIRQLYAKSAFNRNKPLHSRPKSVKVRDFKAAERFIDILLIKFEHFLLNNQDDQLCHTDIYTLIEKDEWYFKFKQNQNQMKGQFYLCKYFRNTNCFGIYVQEGQILNVNKRQGPHAQVKNDCICPKAKVNVRGDCVFTGQQFQEVFGFQFSYQLSKIRIKKIEQVICQKYFLSKKANYNSLVVQPLHTLSIGDNSIDERSFNFHSSRVQFIHKDSEDKYLSPITASIVTVDNMIPMGVKITLYDPYTVTRKGFFIHISPEDWMFQNFHQQENQVIKGSTFDQQKQGDIQMFRKHHQNYSYKLKYFVGYWMERQGFRSILSKVIDKSSGLYIEKNINQIVSWVRIFQQ